MYDLVKQIATMFCVKCGKYKKEELTDELQDRLFDEAVTEYFDMENINNQSAEMYHTNTNIVSKAKNGG